MENEKKNEKIKAAFDNFLDEKTTTNQEMDCSSGVCVIKNDKSILERLNKKIIIEDGRQLLI